MVRNDRQRAELRRLRQDLRQGQPSNVVSIPRLCLFHKTHGSLTPGRSCEVGVCSTLTREMEVEAALGAVNAIADDLVESLERNSDTILGTELGSALAIRALVGWVESNLHLSELSDDPDSPAGRE